jgi:energy-coupling factor transporter ATP-binding protein EcfA2
VIAGFRCVPRGRGALAGSLSGGNLQKYIMGREIGQKPAVLVVSQPTWGVDAGAAAAIHQALVDLAAQGSAIVVISRTSMNCWLCATRSAVINDGQAEPARAGRRARHRNEIGLLMGGIHGDDATPAGGRAMQFRLEKRPRTEPAMLYATPDRDRAGHADFGALIFFGAGLRRHRAVRERLHHPADRYR